MNHRLLGATAIDPGDRGLGYGDGLFESMRLHAGRDAVEDLADPAADLAELGLAKAPGGSGRRADADRAMAFQVQALDFAGAVQLPGDRRLLFQHLGVGLRHQFHQCAVQRHFFAVHVGHRFGEALADQVRADERLHGHEKNSCHGHGMGEGKDRSLLARGQTKNPTNFILPTTDPPARSSV